MLPQLYKDVGIICFKIYLPHLYNKLGVFKSYVRLRKLYKTMCRSLTLPQNDLQMHFASMLQVTKAIFGSWILIL